MTTTKPQQQARLAAAAAIIEAHGGQVAIDNNTPVDERPYLHRQMAKELQAQFVHERMTFRTARGYITKALLRLRGKVVAERRGGSRKGSGAAPGTRKCLHCQRWTAGADPNDVGWTCSSCGARHYPRRRYLKPGEASSVTPSFDDGWKHSIVALQERLTAGRNGAKETPSQDRHAPQFQSSTTQEV